MRGTVRNQVRTKTGQRPIRTFQQWLGIPRQWFHHVRALANASLGLQTKTTKPKAVRGRRVSKKTRGPCWSWPPRVQSRNQYAIIP